MYISLTVNNEHHSHLVSSVVYNMMDYACNDVTLVCSDGQLRVIGLTLALLLPAPFRSLHIGEGPLLILPQLKVQEMWPMVGPEAHKKAQVQNQGVWQNQEMWQNPDKVQLSEEEMVPHPEIKNIEEIKFWNNTKPSKDSDEPFYDMEDSSDEDSDQEQEKENVYRLKDGMLDVHIQI